VSRLAALGFGLRFYLGLGAPVRRVRYPECSVRAARGYPPELVRTLLALYLGRAEEGAGSMERLKYRCGRVTPAGQSDAFFFKEFPRHHFAHDVERHLHLSRVDRAWRAAHLLPRLGLLTPRAVGTAQGRACDGTVMEYLATEWLEDAVPFPQALRLAGDDTEARAARLHEFAHLLRDCHRRGIYVRDFVKNVLVQEQGGTRSYWLTDLDGLHPFRRVTRRRVLFHMAQLAYYCPLSEEEARLVCETYLGTAEGEWAGRVREALQAT